MGKDSNKTEDVVKGPNYKGSYQYITRKKKAYILKTLMYIGIGIAIYVLGLCLNKFQSNNVFTILAILMVLPGAKALVAVVVFWPFASVTKDRVHTVYESLKTNFSDIAEEDTVRCIPEAIDGRLNVYIDMVFTSPEKVMNLDFLVITGSRMIGLQGRKKPALSVLQTYIHDSLTKRGLSFGVKLYDNEEAFLKALKGLRPESLESENNSKKDRDEAIEFIEAIIVK